jgi:hypothetical protein
MDLLWVVVVPVEAILPTPRTQHQKQQVFPVDLRYLLHIQLP